MNTVMQRLICYMLLLLTFLSTETEAQVNGSSPEMQTLFGDGKVNVGWTAALRVSSSEFNSKDAWLVGVQGGLLLNRAVTLGFGGYGITNMPFLPDVNGSGAYAEGGYGGFFFEVSILPNKLVHISVPLLIGGGAISYLQDPFTGSNKSFHENIIATSTFFVVEPGLDIEMNIVRFLRLAAGVNYRYTNDLVLPNTPLDAFKGISYNLTLKFGSF